MVASIRIVRGQSQVNNDSSNASLKNLFGKLTKELKGLKDVFSKAQKLSRSGLSSGGALGGIGKVAGAVTAAGSGAFAALGGMSALGGMQQSTIPGSLGTEQVMPANGLTGTYEEVIQDGVKKFIRVNNLTGALEGIFTEQEAQQIGILDKTGELKNKYTRFNSVFDRMTEGMERQEGAVVLTADTLESIQAKTWKQARLLDKINEAYSAQLSAMGSISNTLALGAGFESVGISSDAGLGTTALDMYKNSSVGSILNADINSDFKVKR